MSVINRMLQELDARREDVHTRGLPGVVRAVPPPALRTRRRFPGWLLALVLTVALVAAFVAWGLRGAQGPSAPAPLAPAVAPMPATTTAPAPPVAAGEPTAPQTLARDAADASTLPALKPSTELTVPAARRTQVPGVKPPEPAKAVASGAASVGAPVAETAPTVVPPAPAGSAKPVLIKQMSDEQRADFRYREALALNNQGRQAEALAALEDALRLDPRHSQARQVLLAMRVEARQFEAAEHLLREALQLGLRSAQYAVALARIQLERGDAAGAAATLNSYQAQAGDSADYHGFHAAVLQQLATVRQWRRSSARSP